MRSWNVVVEGKHCGDSGTNQTTQRPHSHLGHFSLPKEKWGSIRSLGLMEEVVRNTINFMLCKLVRTVRSVEYVAKYFLSIVSAIV